MENAIAIWMSRHTATPAQVAEAEAMGFRLVGAEDLGSRNINTDEDLNVLIRDLRARIAGLEARAIFGVFATPLQSVISAPVEQGMATTPCFAAWNVQRTVEGGRPTFEHRRFVCVGAF